ncbi:temptin-like [Mizuhopecten yessoensis]|uniref:Temptin n=1 Tax=Mizuhopecten yessoensis TaxID=6573 RepID=A0A210QTH5_MIZYE|nr:temptin-like [Mizuhopecten yessoensis]OWF52039.1 Temptin [Mizuhopecten yessoensis]
MISQSTVVLVICSLGSFVLGHPGFMDLIPNGHMVPNPCPNNSSYPWHGVGHNNRTGGGIANVFGADFLTANMTWTKAFCMADSDIDGKTNGFELGDPDCKWVQGGPPAGKPFSHPGVCEPMTSKTCIAVNLNIRCI